MIGQKEIALALGVSNGTVSRALRNHPDLASDTRERILQKAIEMGYPHVPGRAKQRGGVGRLGVLLYERDQDHFWRSTQELPRRILGGIQKECRALHVEMMLETVQPHDTPLMVRNRTVDGVMIMGRYNQEVLSSLRNVPVISVSSYVDNDWVPRVVADNLRAMEKVTEHMISLGHKRILFLGAERNGWTELHRQREKGYRLAMQAHGLTPEVEYCDDYYIPSMAEPILRSKAIVCSGDGIALGVWNFLEEKGKVVPRDCSLAGFDGFEAGEERGLTTYIPDWELMGQLATDFLCLRGQGIQKKGVEIVVPGSLVSRLSVAGV